MEKIKQYWIIILFFFIILATLFYWFQLRPSQVKKECYNTAEWWSKGEGWAFDYHYRQCLRSKGL